MGYKRSEIRNLYGFDGRFSPRELSTYCAIATIPVMYFHSEFLDVLFPSVRRIRHRALILERVYLTTFLNERAVLQARGMLL